MCLPDIIPSLYQMTFYAQILTEQSKHLYQGGLRCLDFQAMLLSWVTLYL